MDSWKLACSGILVSILASVLLFGPAQASKVDTYTIVTEDLAPLNYLVDHKPTGPAVEIVEAILERLGVAGEILTFPWARGYNLALTKHNVVLFSTTRTKERETLFKWVGPIAEKRYGLFAKVGSGIALNSLADARDYTVGTQLDGAAKGLLEDAGISKFSANTKATTNLKMLMGDRFDLWYTSNTTAIASATKLGINYYKMEQVLTVKNSALYIAFSIDTPDSVIEKWQAALDELFREGRVREIYRKYNLDMIYPSAKTSF